MGQYLDISKIIESIQNVARGMSNGIGTGGIIDGVSTKLYGWIDSGEWEQVKVDEWNRALITMDYSDHLTFRGYTFATTASTILGANEKFGLMIKTNSVRPAAIARADLSLAGVFKSYVNPAGIVFKPGNALVASNRNFAMQNTIVSGVSLCTSPGTSPTTGHARKVYIGSDTKKLHSGGASENLPYVLDNSSVYYLEIESFVADNVVTYNIDWSEEPLYGGNYPDGTP